jgi:hypothetical protein
MAATSAGKKVVKNVFSFDPNHDNELPLFGGIRQEKKATT